MPFPFVSAQIGGGRPFTPKTALIVQAERSHDVASFVAASATLPERLYDGTPVALNWGHQPGARQNFHGYVHQIEPFFSDDNPKGRVKVVCIGASWTLMSGLQRSWHQQTADTVVREIATEAYLSADVEPHNVVWPYLAANGTAWSFLLELADKIGYTLAVNGTEVRFISVEEVLRRSIPDAPILGTTTFRPVMGAASEGGRKTRRMAFGMDPRHGRVFSVSGGGEGFLELETDVTGGTPGEIQIGQRRQFVYRADAEAGGNARITQASVVYVKDVAFDFAGHWYVHQVEHEIKDDDYTVYLKLGKDSRGAYAPASPQGFGLRVRSDPYGVVTGTPPPTKQTNGVWRSGWARRAV